MSRRIRLARLLPLVCLGISLIASSAWAGDLGSTIKSFSLPDMYAHERSLDELKDKDIVVVAFFGAECPLARQYGPRLQELSEQYAKQGVAFIGIDANSQDSLTDITTFSRQYGVKFPLLKDRDGTVADQFGAVRNPEVFVLDKARKIVYRGRVDDQYGLGTSSGYARPELKERYLGDALDQLLAGKPVAKNRTDVSGCIIGRTDKVAPKGDVTFTKDVFAILQNRCVECHREGQVGPFSLASFDDAAGWAAMIKEVVSDGRMPPWGANPEFGHFGNDPRLSAEERTKLFTWIDNGCPQGNVADQPKGREWIEGWRISKPDAVYSMQRAFHVPAEGVINYQNFSVDPGWKEDKWIQMAEVIPGAMGNVHHCIVNVSGGFGGARGGRGALEGDEAIAFGEPEAVPARGARGGRGAGRTGGGGGRAVAAGGGSSEGLDTSALRGGKLSAYIPGRNPTVYQPGTAFFAPAGSRISFQMHYTTNGTPADDITRIGIVFADPKSVKFLAHTAGASASNIRIPPYTDNYKIEADTRFSRETQLIVMHPHMHLRGKTMRYEAFYPDSTSEVLLDVPKYDFNWQFEYELHEPKVLPAGTRMHVTATFDNSENNAANPDPSRTVPWGAQSWDEMMIGYYSTVTPVEKAFAGGKAPGTKPAESKPAGGSGEGQ